MRKKPYLIWLSVATTVLLLALFVPHPNNFAWLCQSVFALALFVIFACIVGWIDERLSLKK